MAQQWSTFANSPGAPKACLMLLSSKHTTVVPGTRATRCAGSGAAGEYSTDSLYRAPGPRRPTASCSACTHSNSTVQLALAALAKQRQTLRY